MQEHIEKTYKKRWLILFALSGSLALAFLDQMNLPVALPTIQKQLQLSTLTIQWLINAYLLSWAVFVLTGGYLADHFGLKRIFCLGVVIFAVGSVAGGLSFFGWWFILARGVQGLGTAMMLPSAIGILVSIFPKNQHGKAIGIYSGSASIFLVLGPLMGGFLTQVLNWRWIFFVNIPIAIVSLFIILIVLPLILPEKKKFDFRGFLLFTTGFPCFVLALMQGNSWGWSHWATITLFSFSFVALLLFVLVELNTKLPFLDFTLFKTPSFLGSNLIFFVIQFVLILPVYWAMFLQRILGFSPLTAGLYIMVAVVPLVVVIPLGGILSDIKGGRFPVVLGLTFIFLSLIWFLIFNRLTAILLIPGMLGFGAGLALIFAPISSCVVGGVEPAKRGSASGVLGCIRQVGGTIGMATISAMLANLRLHHFHHLLQKSSYSDIQVNADELDCFYTGAGTLCNMSSSALAALKGMAISSYFFAFRWIYMLCALLVVIALILGWRTIPNKIIQNKVD